jgi:hypothetical protein
MKEGSLGNDVIEIDRRKKNDEKRRKGEKKE